MPTTRRPSLSRRLRRHYSSTSRTRNISQFITLGGAAEEIFGKLLEVKGLGNSFVSLKKAVAEMHQHLYNEVLADEAIATRANRARNHLKHLGASPTVTLDAKQEAQDMLQRMIDNYWLLETRLTPAMERFQAEALRGGAR